MNLGQVCLLRCAARSEISLVTCWPGRHRKNTPSPSPRSSQVFDRTYQGLTVSRPIVAMGQTVGFLPGSLPGKDAPMAAARLRRLDLPHAARRKHPRAFARSRTASCLTREDADTCRTLRSPIQSGVIEVEASPTSAAAASRTAFSCSTRPSSSPRSRPRPSSPACPVAQSRSSSATPRRSTTPTSMPAAMASFTHASVCAGQVFAPMLPLVKGERSPLAEDPPRLL